MKNVIYRWFLSADKGTTKYRAYPVYKDDMALDYELETGQMFHRAKLSGKLDFINEDYDWIMAQDLSLNEIHVYIQVSYDNGETKSEYWHGTFSLTDMEVSVDDKRVTVQPSVLDRYTTLLDGWEREYDIVRNLNPQSVGVRATLQGYWQLYIGGEDKAYNVYGNSIVSEDVENESEETNAGVIANSNYHFQATQQLVAVEVTPQEDNQGRMPVKTDLGGMYVGTTEPINNDDTNFPYADYRIYLRNPDNGYTISITQTWNYTDPNYPVIETYVLFCDVDGTILYNYFVSQSSTIVSRKEYYTLLAQTGQQGRLYLERRNTDIFGRYILNTAESSLSIKVSDASDAVTKTVYNRVSDDLTAKTLNYPNVISCGTDFNTQTIIYISARVSDTPTDYGKNADDKYYLPPTDDAFYLPLYRNIWSGRVSYWVIPLPLAIENKSRRDYTINDTYAISDIIGLFLEKIGTNITHKPTAAYSEFLYAQTNPVSGLSQRLYITPKSNVLVSNYSMAAQKGVTTLKTILDTLCKMFRLYWFVDGDNRLRIEHISYFMQGKSYEGSAWLVSADLTTLLNSRNGKAWAFGKNTYNFNKSSMPERFTFKWMDDVSDTFEGQPIILQSPLVQQDLKDEQSVSQVTTDIGYMLMNSPSMSKDGFAIIATEELNGRTYNGTTYEINGSKMIVLNLYGNLDTWSVQVTLTARAGIDFIPVQLEYGWIEHSIDTHTYNQHWCNKVGEISGQSGETLTITMQSPSRDYKMYIISNYNSMFVYNITIDNIRGGLEAMDEVTSDTTYYYPVPVMAVGNEVSGTATTEKNIISVPLPLPTQEMGNTGTFYKTRITIEELSGGKIAIGTQEYTEAGVYEAQVVATSGSTSVVYRVIPNSGATASYRVRFEGISMPYVVHYSYLNYHLSFEYLLPTYWAYGLPVKWASFNGYPAVETQLPQRMKEQTIKWPIGANADPDTEKLVKTSVGIGTINKVSVNLTSRIATATLQHETI